MPFVPSSYSCSFFNISYLPQNLEMTFLGIFTVWFDQWNMLLCCVYLWIYNFNNFIKLWNQIMYIENNVCKLPQHSGRCSCWYIFWPQLHRNWLIEMHSARNASPTSLVAQWKCSHQTYYYHKCTHTTQTHLLSSFTFILFRKTEKKFFRPHRPRLQEEPVSVVKITVERTGKVPKRTSLNCPKNTCYYYELKYIN